MTRKVLTPSAAMEIKRLYGLMDEKGNRIHSMMELAAQFAVGETTVYRAIHSRSAYLALPEPKTEQEAHDSALRFAERMAAESAGVVQKQAPAAAMLKELGVITPPGPPMSDKAAERLKNLGIKTSPLEE